MLDYTEESIATMRKMSLDITKHLIHSGLSPAQAQAVLAQTLAMAFYAEGISFTEAAKRFDEVLLIVYPDEERVH
jgi:hypothetical protein